MKSIKHLKNLKGKTVLVRVDFNVPIKNSKVLDDFRIKKSLQTIKFLIDKGANVLLITHLGKDGSESLEPVIKRFFKLSKISRDKVSFFENVRKFEGEIKNEPNFAKKLAKLGDIYVNEAFSVSHRTHASIVSLPKYLPSYAGFQLEDEIKNLSKVIKNVKHPFLYITGGAKFSTKLPLIKKYLKLADFIFVGGALANTILKEKGYEVGKSLVDLDNYDFVDIIKNKKLILPIDVIAKTDTFSARAENVSVENKKVDEVKKDEIILDIGNESVKSLTDLIKKSKMTLWNGPLGKYEDGGGKATKKIMNFLLKQKGKEIVIGGGDLVSFVPKSKLETRTSKLKPNLFVSTGGGATLDFLTNGTLPGIKALK